MVYRGAAFYLQDISFTIDVTFWRPKEADRKEGSIFVVTTGYPHIPFISISPGELNFRQNFGSNASPPARPTELSTALTSGSYSIWPTARGADHIRDFQTSFFCPRNTSAAWHLGPTPRRCMDNITQDIQKESSNAMLWQVVCAPQSSLIQDAFWTAIKRNPFSLSRTIPS